MTKQADDKNKRRTKMSERQKQKGRMTKRMKVNITRMCLKILVVN